jgi:hypothetical protein
MKLRTVCVGFAILCGILGVSSAAQERRPTPAEYCVGFPAEACARIKAMVDAAKQPPTFCTFSYGQPERGLTREQVRVCDVTGTRPESRPPGQGTGLADYEARMERLKADCRQHMARLKSIYADLQEVAAKWRAAQGTQKADLEWLFRAQERTYNQSFSEYYDIKGCPGNL